MWVEGIGLHLDIEDNNTKLIIDKTELLSSKEFRLYLSELDREFYYINNSFEIHKYFNNADFNGIIITPDIKIPSYIMDDDGTKIFDYNKIPLNIEYKLYSKLTVEDILKILNYISGKSIYNIYITNENLNEIVHKANLYYYETEQSSVYNKILKLLEKPSDIVNYDDLLYVGELWGKLIYLDYILDSDLNLNLCPNVDDFSQSYILSNKFKDLFYEPYDKLKSVDKILHFIHNQLPFPDNKKLALICFDCMGVSEWELLKNFFSEFNFVEHYLFSLIPSLTSISRGGLYCASATESYFENISEEKRFNNFFQGYTVKHFREKDLLTKDTLLGIEVINIIYNFFDDLSHSCNFPPNAKTKKLYFENLQNYIKGSSLIQDIKLLLELNYKLYFCSDHGSVLSTGNGSKIEKHLQDKFSKRACIIDKELAKITYPNYKQFNIPFIDNKIVIFANNRESFDYIEKVALNHGGISLDEIVVPFIEVV